MVIGYQPKSIDNVTPKLHVLEGSPKDQSKMTTEEKIKVPGMKQQTEQQELTLKAQTEETATKTQLTAQEEVHRSRLIYNNMIALIIICYYDWLYSYNVAWW